MEGLSLAALEGMATGLPVVASDVGGLPEIVEDGVNGFLARPGDPDHLGSRIGDAFAALERDGTRYADAARAVAREHDLPMFIARLHQIYLSLASLAEPS
jgi:glycosyltransferase involved in cell wall biosynthesis